MIITIVFAVILAVSLMQLLVFHANILFAILTVVFSLAGIVLGILKKRLQLSRALTAVAVILLLLLSCGALLLCGRTRKQTTAYEADMKEVSEYLEDGKTDKVLDRLEDMEEDYGSDDRILATRVLTLVSDDRLEDAYQVLDETDDHSMVYYALLEYTLRHDTTDESDARLGEMYLQAASDWPDWIRMQKLAAMVQLKNNRADEAVYILNRSLLRDPEDGEIYYFLGAAYYQKNDIDSMAVNFSKALELGISDERKGEIAWYMEQLGEV